jgi:murein DD-endopeptidase MepM/ murein hydrolase activator NlpD
MGKSEGMVQRSVLGRTKVFNAKLPYAKSVCCLLLLLIPVYVQAQRASVTVQPGDTLYGLAVRYGTSITELQRTNAGISAALQPGDVLTLPSDSTYTVQTGESLSSIAERLGVRLETLMAANGLQASVVNPGTVLIFPDQPQTYTVVEGDTLYDIALAFGVSITTLVQLNGLEGEVIRSGQTLIVSGSPPQTPEAPLVVTIEAGDSLWQIARTHDVSVSELQAANSLSDSATLSVGDTLVIPGHFSQDIHDVGAAATQEITLQKGDTLSVIAAKYNTTIAALVSANNLANSEIQAGATLRIIPGAELAPATTSAGVLGQTLQWPLNGVVTSPFGYRSLRVGGSNFHNALDIDGVTGDPVRAAAGGIVTFSSQQGGYGNLVVIQSGETEYRYAHNAELLVSVGQKVAVGDTISLVGNTGYSFGDHLHFEVRVNGTPVDPMPLLGSR